MAACRSLLTSSWHGSFCQVVSCGRQRKVCASQCAVSSGVSLATSVEELPLSWPVELRRPSGRRRLGPAFVMDAGVQAQLSSLGPLTEMVPGPIAE